MSPNGSGAARGIRRRSQQRLDTRIELIPRGYKLMAASVAVVLLASGIWGVFGRIPTKVPGRGIIVRNDQQMFAVNPTASGQIQDISVTIGDEVEAGQIVATLTIPDLAGQVIAASQTLAEAKAELERTENRLASDLAVRERASNERQRSLSNALDTARKQAARHRDRVEREEELRAQGLRSLDDAIATRESYEATLTRIDDLEAQVAGERTAFEDYRAQIASQRDAAQLDVREQERRLEELRNTEAGHRDVRSPSAGVVEELRFAPGETVGPRDAVLTISSGGSANEALAFLSPADGIRAVEGLSVHVIPSTVREAEYGSMRGEVLSTSDAPVSKAEINGLLRNEQLSESFSVGGSPYLSRIRLFPDSANDSGFEWWAGDGPPFPVTRGTLVQVDIVVDQEPPVALVIPALRALIGL